MRLNRNTKTEWVALGSMAVSERAQREMRKHRIDELVSEFDPDRLGVPVVSKRDDRYFIVDGQHRVFALRQFLGSGWEKQQIECQVFDGLTEPQEAELFLRLNNTLTVNSFERFQKAVVAGRPVEVAVKKVVEAVGFKLAMNSASTTGGISATTTLTKIAKRAGVKTLGRALTIARDAYGDSGTEAAVIDGLAHVCQRYKGMLDDSKVTQRLADARGGMKGLINRANELRLKTGSSKAICVAAAAVDIINQGKGGKKLPSWWHTGTPLD